MSLSSQQSVISITLCGFQKIDWREQQGSLDERASASESLQGSIGSFGSLVRSDRWSGEPQPDRTQGTPPEWDSLRRQAESGIRRPERSLAPAAGPGEARSVGSHQGPISPDQKQKALSQRCFIEQLS